MTITATLKPLLLLFISTFLLMGSHGLSGLFLPLTLKSNNYDLDTIGMVLAMFSLGFLLGAHMSKRLLRQIGLIRTFAACGSLSAVSILVMGTLDEIWIWAFTRAMMGFGIACATTTLDTWFNSVASESNRGKVMAINQIVILLAITIGQFGLVLAPYTEITLFVLSGILFSLSVTPVVFISQYEPEVEPNEALSLSGLYKLSPLGFVTCFVCGFLYSTSLNLFPIYFDEKDIKGSSLSLYMGAATVGAVLLQYPIGYLSDKFERRQVILGSSFTLLFAGLALTVSIIPGAVSLQPLLLLGLFFGINACLYPLSISESFDKAVSAQLVPVLSTLLSVYAIGSIIGPYSVSLVMERFGTDALFSALLLVIVLHIIFTTYRMNIRKPLPVEDQEPFVMHTPTMASESLDPRTEYNDSSLLVEEVMDQVKAIAEHNPTAAIALVKSITNSHPEWAAVLGGRVAALESIDTVRLFRTLTATKPDLALTLVKKLANSNPDQIEELVHWLIEFEPENSIELLVVISESIDFNVAPIIEAMAEQSPEQLAQFSQEVVESLIETNKNQRFADRIESNINNEVEDLLSSIVESAPDEQVEEIQNILKHSTSTT